MNAVGAAATVAGIALVVVGMTTRKRPMQITMQPGAVARTADEADAFYSDMYQALGITPTPELARFAQAWRLSEGGRAAWNPFNTKWKGGKSGDYIPNGVANYPDRAAGLAATVKTLRLRYYDDLRARMTAGAPAVDVAASPALKTWGTGDLVRRVLLANTGPIPYRSPLWGA